jgi:hypothetical protein
VFYRYTKAGARIAVDMDGLYEGEDLFLLGGSPTLNDLPLDLLRKPGVITMGMNNVPCVFMPNLWIGADKPDCFSPHIHASPEVTKFTMITRRDLIVPGTGKKVREFPSFFFFGAHDKFTFENFLDPARDLAWWRSTFPMALQLAHRLGFKRVFLVGCGFNMNKTPGKQYAWSTGLSEEQAQYSANTYSRDVARVKGLLPTFQRKSFYLVSCTPGSEVNSLIPYVPLAKAVDEVTSAKPSVADTNKLIHSSELKNLGQNSPALQPAARG